MRVVRGLEGHLTPECLGRDLVTLSLTPRHLLTAHSSGYVNLYRRRDSFSLEKKISRRVTSRDNITVVSLGPSLVCVGCRSGEVVLLHLSPVTVTILSIHESVTALSGSSGSEIYVGGEAGCVAVYSNQTKDTRQILDLGTSVVQIEVSGDTVVTSTTANTFISNTRLKTFRQVGTQQGAGSHHHGLSITGGQVWSSRPGARLWRVDLSTGDVLATVKYKQLLDCLPPSQINSELPTASNTRDHSFTSLNTDSNGLTVTFNNSGNILYILDIKQRQVIAWTPVTFIKIKEAHIERDLVLLVGSKGEVVGLRFGDILDLSQHCLSLERDDLLHQLLRSVYEDEQLAEYSQVDLSRIYCLCLHLQPRLTQMERDILDMLGGSPDLLSRSAPTQSSLLLPDRNHTRRNSDPAVADNQEMSKPEKCDNNGINNNVDYDYDPGDLPYESCSLMDLPFAALDLDVAYHGETLFGADLVQEFGKIFLRSSGTDDSSETVKRDLLKELMVVCSDVQEEGGEMSDERVSQLTECFSNLLTEKCQNNQVPLEAVLSGLSPTDQDKVSGIISRIFSSPHSRDLFIQPPLLDLLGDSLPVERLPRHAVRQLVMMFDQEVSHRDRAVASLLLLLSPGAEWTSLLDISSYCSVDVLLRLEQERRPTLAPIPLEQITESTVYENVNILSQCSDLTTLQVLRYCLHISTIDADCAIHFLQNFVLELPLPCIFYFCLAQYEQQSVLGSGELGLALESDLFSLLARSAALHIPGWSEAWSEALHSHPNLLGYFTQALKVTNERRLSKVPNIVGAHKSAESLELVSLADFLASHLSLTPTQTAAFFQQSYNFPGLARLASQDQEVALACLPVLLELGDVDLLSRSGLLADHAQEVVDHLVLVYPLGTDLPLDLHQLGLSLLSQVGGERTHELMMVLATAGILSRGSLGQRFYCRLILRRLEERRTQ